MSFPRRFLLPTVIIGILVAAAGCGDQASEQPPDSVRDPLIPTPGGQLSIALEADPGTLNSLRMTTSHAARVFALLQPGLFRYDAATGQWNPGLAKGWSFGPDSSSVDLELDSAFRWSDGTPFSAADIVTSWEIYLDEESAYPRRSRLRSLASFEAIDSMVIHVEFAERTQDPLSLLAHDVLPSHVVGDLPRNRVEEWSIGRSPITLGAYRLARWEFGNHLLLERNPYYQGPTPHLESITLKIVPDAAVRLLQLRTGEVDLVASIPPSHADELRRSGTNVVELGGRTVAFLQYELTDPVLSDVRVRRAISYGIDRRALVDGVLFGMGRAAASLLPPVSWAHDASIAPDSYDPRRAGELLREAGFERADDSASLSRNGVPLELQMLSVSGDPAREAAATAIQAQLRRIGIALSVRPLELGSFLRAAQDDGFQILFARLGGPIDADLRPFLRSDGRFNFGHYASPRFDQLADRAALAFDREEARQNAILMQKMLMEEQPLTVLYYPPTVVGLNPRVRGATPSWLSPFEGIEHWWISTTTGAPAGAEATTSGR